MALEYIGRYRESRGDFYYPVDHRSTRLFLSGLHGLRGAAALGLIEAPRVRFGSCIIKQIIVLKLVL